MTLVRPRGGRRDRSSTDGDTFSRMRTSKRPALERLHQSLEAGRTSRSDRRLLRRRERCVSKPPIVKGVRRTYFKQSTGNRSNAGRDPSDGSDMR
jgi:hypothetical protein